MAESVLDLRGFVADIEGIVARHGLGSPGSYRRWTRQDAAGRRDLGRNPYGCADAANLLYTIGRFPGAAAERAGWIESLQSLQDPRDGLFREATHHELHTTAHCVAALELFDARPTHPLVGLRELARADAVAPFLEGLDWRSNPWIASHRGAGLYAALLLAGELPPGWDEAYFGWLARECDVATGCWRRGAAPPLPEGGRSIFPHLAGTFHYLFNLEYARRPHPHPEALVDTCLAVDAGRLFPLAHFVGFADVDWVYCLNRARRQTAHRFDAATHALEAFAERYVAFLLALDAGTDDGLDDLHSLFGAVCALAELQAACPGRLRTETPLRLVLDRRPFI